MSNNNVHIAVLIMVKNEKKRLSVTLESIKNFADSLVIFDTGSTDNTIQICKDFCEENNIPLRLKEGEFVNFEVSRNVSLEFADSFPDIDYLLLLDTNDELRGSSFLRKCANEYINNKSSGFLLCQQWWSGSMDKYFNVRFIKAHKKWRYVGSVHEYIKTFDEECDKEPIVRLPDTIILYQDRTQDDDKSGKRFKRDKELLLAEYNKNPNEPRTVFYLAQTCSCLNDNEDSLYYYKIRATLDGFEEERFHSFLRAGELCQKLNHDWYDSLVWYMKAFEHSSRVEPLLCLAFHYVNVKNWILAYTYLKLACNIQYPSDAILFVNRQDYDYKRWHLMGISAFYVNQFEDGYHACKIAIEFCEKNTNVFNQLNVDKKNLTFYEQKLFENGIIKPLTQQQNSSSFINNNTHLQPQNNSLTDEILTKKKFIENKMLELNKENPKLTQKQLHTRANMAWKNIRKK
jgi:glycosyltransferase involved in cell wall biosynthesis